MKRTALLVIIVWLGSMALAAQSYNLKIGIFQPSLKSDLWQTNMENLAFKNSDMLNAYYAFEYEFFLNSYSSFSVELGSYKRDVYSEYRDYEYDDGTPILQNFSLRITPLEFTYRFYPIGHRRSFIPYLGVGGGAYFWRYEQWGEFIDFETGDVNEGNAITRTTTFGFNARAGFVLRLMRSLGIAFEGKYQFLRGQLSGYFEGFERLDLGGFTATLGLNVYLR
jgi:outer membrane protein W